MASATLGSAYAVSDEGVETLIGLAEHDSTPSGANFVSRRVDADRLAFLAAQYHSRLARSEA